MTIKSIILLLTIKSLRNTIFMRQNALKTWKIIQFKKEDGRSKLKRNSLWKRQILLCRRREKREWVWGGRVWGGRNERWPRLTRTIYKRELSTIESINSLEPYSKNSKHFCALKLDKCPLKKKKSYNHNITFST